MAKEAGANNKDVICRLNLQIFFTKKKIIIIIYAKLMGKVLEKEINHCKSVASSSVGC